MSNHNFFKQQENDSIVFKKKKFYFSLLIILLVLATTLFLCQRTSQEEFSNPYPFIDPARSIISQENFIINLQPLREDLRNVVEGAQPDKVGLYFEVLNTGANISINQDDRFWPASLSKVPVAMVVMKKIEGGEWDYNDQLVLFSEDVDERYGELYKKPIGTRFTIEELLKEMLVNSDNTAMNIFIRNLGTESFEELLDDLGMAELYDAQYNISPKEFSRIFRSLYVSSFLKREYSQKILDLLSSSDFDQYLGGVIPGDVPFAHKIGEQDDQKAYLDSGIVYIANRPYLITLMIKLENNSEKERAEEISQEISQKIFDYVKNY